MTTFQPTTHDPSTSRPRRANHRRRQSLRGRRGSAIILVIVAIVLMAVLGATFVQVARFERISTGGEHIDIAIDSILNEVAAVLAQDLYDDNGNFFNPAGSAGLDGGADEPFDFPWRNPNISARPITFVDPSVGDPAFSLGGVYDDPWLTSGTLNATTNRWDKPSDLLGRFLAYTDADLTYLNQSNPAETEVNPGNLAFFENLDINDIRLVDADGDGIGDSLWAYAPAAEIAGKRYVYAIRIVDLSARLNVNTAVGPNASLTNTTTTMRGDTPVEVNGREFVAHFGGAAVEFDNTVAHRINTGAWPVWGDATDQRRHYWLHGASNVDTSLANRADDTLYPNYAIADTYAQGDLIELLYKGGLNNPSVTTSLEQAGIGLPNLLRAGSGTEFSADSLIANATTVPANASVYLRNNPRLHATPFSGVMAIAPAAGTVASLQSSGERVLQADINHSSLSDLYEAIRDTLDDGVFYPSTTTFGHLGSGVNFAAQLTVNTVDLRDPDNRLTTHVPTGRWGMEALPFVSEVYAERPYVPGPAPIPPALQTYTAAGPEADFAIEIRNPFNRPISLENIYMSIGAAGATPRNLVTDLGAPSTLDVGDYVIIYKEASLPGSMTAVGRPLDGIPAANLAGIQFPDDWPNTAGANQVRLHAEAQAGAGLALAWGYTAVDIDATPANETTTNAAVLPAPPNPFVYFQYSYHGTIDWDMLQVDPTGYDTGGHSDPETAYTTPLPTAFGSNTKSGGVTLASGNTWNGGNQQWMFLDKRTSVTDNDGHIPYVADLLAIPVIGPTPTTTLAEEVGTSGASSLPELMLDFTNSASVVTNAASTLNVPHAVLLMSRLTTHSPAVDGFDLDGDMLSEANGTTPDLDEVFVPGKINLNTASREIIAATLPFPDDFASTNAASKRLAIADAIISYRNNPDRTAGYGAANANNTPGIAYPAELFDTTANVMELAFFNSASVGTPAGTPAGWDWNNYQDNGTTSGAYSTPDGITGDREEDLMLSKWLNEVCSTRSDVFAVYMVVQGFPAGNFGAGAVESARVVAVFSRANVRQVGDKAQLIAVRRVE